MNKEAASANQLRHSFIGWQCRLRQDAMRRQDGCPGKGMCPVLILNGEFIQRIIVLLMPTDLKALIQEFRFMYQKTEDTADRRERVVKVMAASFFQQPEEFSGLMTALFSAQPSFAKRILESKVILHFEQYDQHYHLPCTVKVLRKNQQAYQFTYWHNSLFNPELPPDISVLAFTPDWGSVR